MNDCFSCLLCRRWRRWRRCIRVGLSKSVFCTLISLFGIKKIVIYTLAIFFPFFFFPVFSPLFPPSLSPSLLPSLPFFLPSIISSLVEKNKMPQNNLSHEDLYKCKRWKRQVQTLRTLCKNVCCTVSKELDFVCGMCVCAHPVWTALMSGGLLFLIKWEFSLIEKSTED